MESNAIDWRSLLDKAVATYPKGKLGIAIRLGVSRTYVSRVMNPDGKSALKKISPSFIQRVIDRLHVVPECPATFQPVPYSDCRKGNGKAPIHNPLSMRIWRVCQTCPNRPTPGETS